MMTDKDIYLDEEVEYDQRKECNEEDDPKCSWIDRDRKPIEDMESARRGVLQ